MIFLRAPNERSGLDIFSEKTASELRDLGIPCSFKELWQPTMYKLFCSGYLPFGNRIFRKFISGSMALNSLRKGGPGDTAFILSFCSPFNSTAIVESKIKSRGLKYLFYMADDWFDFPALEQGAIFRCRLADLVGVPTNYLRDRVLEVVPTAKVETFEEPIDISRLRNPSVQGFSETPTVLWCGNPFNLEHAKMILGVLRTLRRRFSFRFRVICGQPPPKDFNIGLDFEWLPFCHEKEGSLIAGSWLGLAPMPDTRHNRCKGAYKVKTYLAAGLPVVASPVGFQNDLIEKGPNVGFLPKTSAEWEDAIFSLLQNRKLAEEMGQRAKSYAENCFSYKVVCPAWASILRKYFLVS